MEAPAKSPFSIRSFRPSDAAACKLLYLEGIISGKIADNDTGYDIDDIESAYLKYPGNHFWVSQTEDGQVVGMVGVQQHDEGVGEIRRLRVAVPFRRRGIGTALMETALKFCQDKLYLKVKLDTYMEQTAAVQLFEKFRFHHDHNKTLGDKVLMYFYFDLYSRGQGSQE
ncbi:MAG TPA: GNAT family N-acetyltransferase [Tepidisphaeraceae bacterium]|jgi:ribosomal protein S18 acetylase RimI-like enzyme|nr:GNAT family N-acetyltransferase [Tepidisphaeraceae bacterium]